jgi:hypothetical protein
MAAGQKVLFRRSNRSAVLAKAGFEHRERGQQPIRVRGIDFYQRVDIECRDGGALKHGRDPADDDVLDAVLVKQLENPKEALGRHNGVPH